MKNSDLYDEIERLCVLIRDAKDPTWDGNHAVHIQNVVDVLRKRQKGLAKSKEKPDIDGFWIRVVQEEGKPKFFHHLVECTDYCEHPLCNFQLCIDGVGCVCEAQKGQWFLASD